MDEKLTERLIQEAWDRGDPPPLEYFVSRLCKSKRKRQRKKWAGQRFVRVLGQVSKFSQKNKKGFMSIRSMPSNEKFRKNYDRVFRGRMVKVENYLIGDPEPKTIEWTVLNDPSDWSIPQKRKVKK